MEVGRSWKGLGKSVMFFTYHSLAQECTEMPDTAEDENTSTSETAGQLRKEAATCKGSGCE